MFAINALRYYLNACLINFICPLHDHVQVSHVSYLLSRYFDFYYKSLWAGKLNVHHMILQCGTPQTTIYACAWFSCHVFVCILISVWVFVIRLDMYISWHLMPPNIFSSACFSLHTQPSLIYRKTLDILICMTTNFTFYAYRLITHFIYILCGHIRNEIVTSMFPNIKINALLFANGHYKWIKSPNLHVPVHWCPLRKRYISTKVRVSRTICRWENVNEWIYHIGILDKSLLVPIMCRMIFFQVQVHVVYTFLWFIVVGYRSINESQKCGRS